MSSLLRIVIEGLQNVSRRFPSGDPAHLETGRRGESEAYLYLHEHGYRIIERNLRQHGHHGEIDLIGWDKGTLCFIEVKTRTGEGLTSPEAAVDPAKRQHLRAVARRYLRRLNRQSMPTCRFDIVSITYPEDALGHNGSRPELKLIKNAFGWEAMPKGRRY